MNKTGKILLTLFYFLAIPHHAFAAIHASIDRNQVPQDESITLKITHSGNSSDEFEPKFDAPDFEIMNQFESSQFSSVYINGKFENKSERSVTYVLRPLKVGALRIKSISNGSESAPEITVQVVRENAYGKSVGDEAPSLQGDQRNFFIRAEVNKSKIYRGEQAIISFYLYRRTKVNIRDVLQYPSFQGFIREDLEMPLLASRMEYEAVNLGGVPFERALLARYAVYPVKEGKLKIEGLSVRADYIPKNAANDDLLEDPFFQFFSQVTPRTASSRSDPISIDVLSLPEEGKTSNFTGGVGDFEVSARVDQTQIKSNAPLTLKVTVKGRGNTSLIEFPKINWPKEFKYYESQGHSKAVGQGITEKTFEVVVVPLQTGEITIPSIPFDFFNPNVRSYVQKKTDPITIQVLEGEAGGTEPPPTIQNTDNQNASTSLLPAENKNFGSLRSNESSKTEGTGSFMGQPWWRWVAWAGLLVLFSFAGLIVYDHFKKRSTQRSDVLKKQESINAKWEQLENDSQNSVLASVFEKVTDELHQTIDENFKISSRSLPQRELAKILTENHGFSAEDLKHLRRVFEFSEMVRFASQSTAVDSTLKAEALEIITIAKNLCASIMSK